jgi:hypothetical protein
MPNIIWSDYLQYRAKLRGFELAKIEEILKYSGERYYDTETGRLIAVGKHDNRLVIISYEYDDNFITPVTIHATTRQQIRFRLTTGRYTIHEQT